MSTKYITKCKICYLRSEECFCDTLQQYPHHHRITLVTNAKEQRIVSNTGRYIPLLLENSQTVLVGSEKWETEMSEILNDETYHHVLLFPAPNSPAPQEIAHSATKPLNIIILDTSWRAARRWSYKASFATLPRIELKESWRSNYLLRSTGRENHLCTIESLARLFDELHEPALKPISEQIDTILQRVVMSLGRERGKDFARADGSKKYG